MKSKIDCKIRYPSYKKKEILRNVKSALNSTLDNFLGGIVFLHSCVED